MSRLYSHLQIVVLCSFTVLLLGVFTPPAAQAQDDPLITIAVPDWMQPLLGGEFFADFEVQHGVNVEAVPLPPLTTSIAIHPQLALEEAAQYASAADVVYVGGISPFNVRAGLWLDLQPFIDSDPTINLDDFFPTALHNFAWAGGQWALPITADIHLFTYNKNRFDEAGLAYPNQDWTLDDVLNAARALTTYSPDGDIDVPGFSGTYSLGRFAAIDRLPIMSDDGLPTFQQLAPVVEKWMTFVREIWTDGQIDYQAVPFRMESVWKLLPADESGDDWRGALLPNVTALVSASGLAVSSGTSHPELAYELVKFMSLNAEWINLSPNTIPVRPSMMDAFFARTPANPEVRALIETGVSDGIPQSAFVYDEFLWLVAGKIILNNLDATTVLQQLEQAARDALETAADFGQNTNLTVATPVYSTSA